MSNTAQNTNTANHGNPHNVHTVEFCLLETQLSQLMAHLCVTACSLLIQGHLSLVFLHAHVLILLTPPSHCPIKNRMQHKKEKLAEVGH